MGSVEALYEADALRADALRIDEAMRLERTAFAAKLRAARAVLGLSQDQFGHQIGLTQKSVHRIENGDVQPKVRTIFLIEQFLRSRGISFESSGNGGFRLIIERSVVERLSVSDDEFGLSPS